MNCQHVQSSLSLYLYGELDFAREEDLESHLSQCASCQLLLAREKQWHTLTNSQTQEVPLDLLADCRQQLRPAIAREVAHPLAAHRWWPWKNPFELSAPRWSAQLALGSMLVFIGFGSARWLDRSETRLNTSEMSLFNPASSHIRDIQTDNTGLVRIVLEQQGEISGHINDANVRRLLLAGTRQADPGVRYYSFEILNTATGPQSGNDLREVLFNSIRNDPNPAVRLEAIEGLRRFPADPAALETLKFVLEHDDNPGVRSQAIDILAPLSGNIHVTPAAAQALQDVMRSSPDDEYVRGRCLQVLREAGMPVVY